MENNKETETKIALYRTLLGFVLSFTLISIIGIGITLFRWHRKSQLPIALEEKEAKLLETEFEQLEQEIKQKTIPLESKIEIMYGKDIGRLEPFQAPTE